MSQSISRLIIKAERLRSRYIKHRNFLIIISVIVGALSALAAVLLKIFVQFVEHKVTMLNDMMNSNSLSATFPLIGTGISFLLIFKFWGGRLNRGVGFIVQSIFTQRSQIAKRHVFGQLLTSAITVAFGGSVGLEAPIVATGAAIGSNTAHDLRLSYRDTTLLLACGVASGIAAVFNSPIAGIIFALEILMIDFKIPTLIPLLISTATATVLSQILYPDKFIFLAINGWSLNAIPFYILMGLCCGFVSVYTTLITEKTEGFFSKRKPGWKTWLIAGIPLCIVIFFLPNLYGEGYSMITHLLKGDYEIITKHTFLHIPGNKPAVIIFICILMIIFKAITASLTIAAGGNGGTFAPSLIIGGLVGFTFTYIINTSGYYELNTPNFIIVAMAGVLAGVMHAPLTAIFLLAEITGGYTLFVPLMVVTALSYFITRKYVRHSMYHKILVQKEILKKEDEHYL